MRRIFHIGAAGAAFLIAGCASNDGGYEVADSGESVSEVALVAPPAELDGTVIRAASVDGSVVNRVHFYPDGAIRIVPEDGQSALPGTYTVQGEQLCLHWQPRGSECWPYARAFQPGETVSLTSNRGQTLRITLVDADGVPIPAAPAAAAPMPAPAPANSAPPAAPIRAGERG